MAVRAQIFSGFCSGSAQDMLLDTSNLLFDLPQQEQQQVFMQRPPSSSKNNTDNPRQPVPITFLSDDISAQIDSQRWELDQFLNSQNEMLRMALNEQRKHQISALLKSYEPKIQFLLNQKEEEINKARNRTLELETILRKLQDESHGWQHAAKEHEATVARLNSAIAGLREAAFNNTAVADDAESSCDNVEVMRRGKNVVRYDSDEERVRKKCRRGGTGTNPKCGSCGFMKSTVVLLPCRHLCSCRDCAKFLEICPVCKMDKTAFVEAFF